MKMIVHRFHITLVICLVILSIPVTSWSKGGIIKIEIVGDNLASRIEIYDPTILKQFSIWNGPHVRMNGKQYHLDPDSQDGVFIDWPRGMQTGKRKGLQRLEVTFLIGNPQKPDYRSSGRYIFLYEIDTTDGQGYIYLPRWKPYIPHSIADKWFYASKPWDQLIMPIIKQFSVVSSELKNNYWLACTVGTGSMMSDGTIELNLLDDYGKVRGKFRYQAKDHMYLIVKRHLGEAPTGETIDIPCWPMRG